MKVSILAVLLSSALFCCDAQAQVNVKSLYCFVAAHAYMEAIAEEYEHPSVSQPGEFPPAVVAAANRVYDICGESASKVLTMVINALDF
ncbi:MAG: hypothetical protein K1X79_06275 [Oligoflexia bacterium]|nr:hypothetical protein [Oligoflexia bacterium]